MAISFKTKLSKTKNQQTITVTRDDNVDLSAVTSMTATVYKNSESTSTNTYAFTSQNLTDFKAGSVDIATSDLIGSATPDDGFYTVEFDGNLSAYVSERAGIAMTLTALYQALSKQGQISVYAQDFRVDKKLLTAFMLAYEMDNLEYQDSSNQKITDFTNREDTLKLMLNYE